MAGALALSIPVSVYTSRVTIGRGLRENGILLIPEESQPPRVLRTLRDEIEAAPGAWLPRSGGRSRMNAVLRAAVNRRTRFTGRPALPAARWLTRPRMAWPRRPRPAAEDDAAGDSESLFQLHQRIWTSPDSHDDWYGVAAGQTDAPDDNS